MKFLNSIQTNLLGILLLSIFCGVLTKEVHSRLGGAPAWRFSPADPLRLEAEKEGFPLISTAEARMLQASGTHLFLDARSLAEYSQSHIPGAMPLPISDFESTFPDLAPILLPDSPLVTYCSGAACDEALRLARRLRDAGQRNVSIYLTGMDGWNVEAAK